MFVQLPPREFIPDNALISKLNGIACSANVVSEVMCENAIFLICGYDWNSTNLTLIPTIAGHFPAGGSSKQFDHFSQVSNKGTERQAFFIVLFYKMLTTQQQINANATKGIVPLHFKRSPLQRWIKNKRIVHSIVWLKTTAFQSVLCSLPVCDTDTFSGVPVLNRSISENITSKYVITPY